MATRISEVISLLMMFGGFATIIFGDFIDGIWIVVLGWFIKSGAETSLSATLVGETLSGVMVNDIMTRNVLTVPPDILVEQLIADYLLVHRHGGYPVVKNGKMLGLVTMQSVRSVPKELRSVRIVEEIMVPIERVVTVNPTLSALDAMQKMGRARIGRLLVVDGTQLLGIVTSGDIMRTVHLRQELGVGGEQRWTPPSTIPTIPLKHCVQCGGELAAGIKFCPHCGSKQPE
jgi:CBS domain-containing protein